MKFTANACSIQLSTLLFHKRNICSSHCLFYSYVFLREGHREAELHRKVSESSGYVQRLQQHRSRSTVHSGTKSHSYKTAVHRYISTSHCCLRIYFLCVRIMFLSLSLMQVVELDLSTVVPCCSGPKRPQDRVSVSEMKQDFETCLGAKVHVTDTPGKTHRTHMSFESRDNAVFSFLTNPQK